MGCFVISGKGGGVEWLGGIVVDKDMIFEVEVKRRPSASLVAILAWKDMLGSRD